MSSLSGQYYNLSQFGLAPGMLIEREEHKNMLI